MDGMKLSDADLESLLRGGESHRVERKESLDGSAKESIAEAICAFANDLGGEGEPGVIFVGVKDGANEASGFKPDDRALQTLLDMKTDGRISPPPSMLAEARTVAGLRLAVVTVLPSTSPPLRFNGRIHVRSGARRGVATAQDERVLNERRRHFDKFYDSQPVRGATLDDLHLRVFELDYLPSAFTPDILAENNRTVEQQLASTGMIVSINDPTPTVTGMLVLGRDTDRYFPGFRIQFLRVDGFDLADPMVDALETQGRLADQIHSIDDKLQAHITVAVDITSSTLEKRSANYPFGALKQLLRNAVMHRNYEGTNAPTKVCWFNDRIEFINPGAPYGEVTPQNIGTPGKVDYRNPNLANAMRGLKFVQRYGMGLVLAKRLLDEAGHPPLEFDISGNFTTAIVRGLPK